MFGLVRNISLTLFTVKTERNSTPEVFIRKGVLKICRKFTEEHPCRSVISIILQSTLQLSRNHTSKGYSPVNLLCIFRAPFPKNTSGKPTSKQIKPLLKSLKKTFSKTSVKSCNFKIALSINFQKPNLEVLF